MSYRDEPGSGWPLLLLLIVIALIVAQFIR
jgi:hypothetical protein